VKLSYKLSYMFTPNYEITNGPHLGQPNVHILEFIERFPEWMQIIFFIL
jgi:hypothetical protein